MPNISCVVTSPLSGIFLTIQQHIWDWRILCILDNSYRIIVQFQMSDIIDVSVGPIIYNKFIDTLSVGPNCPANPGGVRA